MDPSEFMFNVALPVLVVLAIARRGFRVDQNYVERWADSAQVELTDENRPVVRRYLAWSRRSRTSGALIGFLAPLVYARDAGKPDSGWELPLLLVGYLLGALFAELVINRPRRGPGAALLVPRRLGDYLPAYVTLLQRGLAIASVALVVIFALWPGRVSGRLLIDQLRSLNITSVSTLGFAVFGLVGLCIGAVIEFLQRAIVARRQPVASAGDLRADDAIRSSSLHVIAGAGVGLLLNVVGIEVSVLALAGGHAGPSGIVGWSLLALGGLLWLSSIFFWLDLAKPHGFKVRREAPQGAVA